MYGLRETYIDLGRYEFKIVLNPNRFKSGHLSTVTMKNSDGELMPLEVKKWGRKINCSFVIDQTVSDGVCLVELDLVEENGQKTKSVVRAWVVKP